MTSPGVYLPGSSMQPSSRISEAIGRPADRRTGTVVAFTGGVLSVSVGGGEPEAVGYLSSYPPVVGDVVCLVLQRSTWVCVGRLADSAAPLPPTSNSDWYSSGVGGGSTTSATFVHLAGALPFTKRRPESRVYAHLAGSAYAASPSSGSEWAVRIGGVDYSLAFFYFNNSFVHLSFSGFKHLSGIPAGTYTASMSFRLTSGTGAIVFDGNDRFSLLCAEVD